MSIYTNSWERSHNKSGVLHRHLCRYRRAGHRAGLAVGAAAAAFEQGKAGALSAVVVGEWRAAMSERDFDLVAVIEAELRKRIGDKPMSPDEVKAALREMCQPSDLGRVIDVRPDPDNPGSVIVEFEHVDQLIEIIGTISKP